MHTTRLPTVRASVDIYQMSTPVGERGGVCGPQVNQLEQVSSLGHQMSLAGVRLLYRGGLYSEVQCILGNGHMGTPCGAPSPPPRQLAGDTYGIKIPYYVTPPDMNCLNNVLTSKSVVHLDVALSLEAFTFYFILKVDLLFT